MSHRFPHIPSTLLAALLTLCMASCRETGDVQVTGITFSGNKAIDASQLKAVIATQENGFLPWSRKHFFDRPEFDRDVKRIEAFYTDRGYPGARVAGVDAKLNDAQDKVAITVEISEGTPVLVENLSVEGLDALPEFPCVDDRTLEAGMIEAARLGLPVAVHAESEAITRRLSQSTTGTDARAFLDSRPVAAEVEAIGHAVELARQTGVRLHIVHVSSGSGVLKAAEGRANGADVSIETCPHYLFFTEDDLEQLGVVAKCAPPLRAADEQGGLWNELLDGRVDIIASDHSPSEPSLKQEGDFRNSLGGIAGVQSTLAVLLERGRDGRRLRFERIVSLLAGNPAQRFGIRGKGSVAVGNDADLLLLNPAAAYTLEAGDLQQRHKMSPYLGVEFGGVVRRTIRRGETIFADGKITATGRGKFVRPQYQ